ncbi:MAG: hypothetical protein IKD72_11280 [Clostridia bacterium]|nr:hypothetical protein [Clostridia bacterium]
MRRTVIACALLAVTALGCVALHCAVLARTARLAQDVAALLRLCETATPAELEAETRAFLQDSAPTLRLLHCTTGHETVDALARQLETLPASSADRAAYRAQCVEMLALLRTLRQAQRVDLENVLFFGRLAVS